MSDHSIDDLFAQPRDPSAAFCFDEGVARVFPDMVQRSVPGYAELVRLSALVGARFLHPATRVYDLGCSLGAVALALRGYAIERDCDIIAVDSAPAMITGLRARLGGNLDCVRPICADLESVRIEGASLVVLNLTLQFLPPERRLPLLAGIRRGLLPGGALILSEKVVAHDPKAQSLLAALHEDFKRANGYSELEISQKRSALERVLIPDSPEIHTERLREAGFADSLCWFRCLNFVSLLAWT